MVLKYDVEGNLNEIWRNEGLKFPPPPEQWVGRALLTTPYRQEESERLRAGTWGGGVNWKIYETKKAQCKIEKIMMTQKKKPKINFVGW